MTMQVKDVMSRNVISVPANETILKAVQLMLENRISGLPVTDARGNLVGIVTEGDFLRRREIGTQRRRPRWLEFLIGPGPLALEYVRASGTRVDEVMTPNPYTITEGQSLETVVELMQRHNIKRIPVLREGQIVGIVSRANLMQALASLAHYIPVPAGGDREIREQILKTLAKQHWGWSINVIVHGGVVELWGTLTDERERQAAIVDAENVPGVREVHDHLASVEPMTGMMISSAEDDEAQRRSLA
jgi:CBS-domain-containing membrane protein